MMSSFETVAASLLKRMPTFRSSNHSTILFPIQAKSEDDD
jgi:hypothetical protein